MQHRRTIGALGWTAAAAGALLVGSLAVPAGGQTVSSPVQFATAGTTPFVVPAQVCSITVDAIGAQGAADVDDLAPGGLGGEAVATISVTPGQTLQVIVGATGTPGGAGGAPDGAAGGLGLASGSGGGGSSSVEQGGSRVVIAGGGGGAAFGFNPSGSNPNTHAISGGAGGGTSGMQGGTGPFANSGQGGGGGTQTIGGSAGTGGGSNNGDQGIPNGDGVGGSGFLGGGGGGGGLTGGGGGGAAEVTTAGFTGGGGGGGSGFTPTGTGMTTGVDAHNSGNGMVTLTFTPDPSCGATAATIVATAQFTG